MPSSLSEQQAGHLGWGGGGLCSSRLCSHGLAAAAQLERRQISLFRRVAAAARLTSTRGWHLPLQQKSSLFAGDSRAFVGFVGVILLGWHGSGWKGRGGGGHFVGSTR
jgi:hypothetical protein